MPRPATGGTEFGEHAISKPRRPRWTPSEDATALLEKVFSADSFPTLAVRSQLAEQLSIDSHCWLSFEIRGLWPKKIVITSSYGKWLQPITGK